MIELLGLYNEHQTLQLPLPDNAALAKLVAGEAITLSERLIKNGQEDDRVRVVGYRLFPRSQPVIWVSALYKPLDPDNPMIEYMVPGDAGGYQLYQYLPLPWPIKDRHWKITVQKALNLAQVTADQIWEHHWQLTENGESTMEALVARGQLPRLDEKQFKQAVYLPDNRGGWTAFRVDDELTLLASHVSTLVSNWIPDSFVAAYSRRRVNNMMREIDRFASNIDQAYDPQHYLVYSGNGEPIYPAALLQKENASD